MISSIKISIIAIVLFMSNLSIAANCSAITSGNWDNPSNWSCGSVPSCSDNVVIPSGITIIVNNHINLDETSTPACSSGVYITVMGTLHFVSGKKISLACGSYVEIISGGKMEKGTGGGSSNLLDICATTVWKAGDGDVAGYKLYGVKPTSLAVTFIQFDIAQNKNNFTFNWEVQGEMNNDFFEIKHSFDGIHWKNTNFVNSIGNHSDQYIYQSTTQIERFEKEIIYFQLRETNKNGTSSILDTKSIIFDDLNSHIFPNPLNESGIVNIQIEASNTISSIKLFSANGQLIHSENIQPSSSNQLIQIDCSIFNFGTYFIQITNGNVAEHHKIIK